MSVKVLTVILIKKTYHLCYMIVSVYTSLPLIFNVYVLMT